MIGKLVASQLAGSNVGRAIGPILKLSEHVEGAIKAGINAPKGILQNVIDLLGGEGAPVPAGQVAEGGTIPLSSGGISFAPPPDVGGVLFDMAAEVLTELEEITGAYWDDKLGQLVLIGKKNGKIEQQYLPRMDKDHLAVAISTIFSGDNLGVSIDPPPSYLESGEFPSDGTEMLVKYLGNTQATLFGAIMFEADRLLKNLSMGTDNETRKEVTSQVDDFWNELDLSLKYGTEKKSAWHRMWFVIEDMKLEMPVKEAPDRNALSFSEATLKVKAEYLSKEENPGVDPIAERFAKHFTLHFDDFAKEYPVLERLRELAKIAAIAKYLKNSGKPIDLSFLDDHEFIKVDTPKDTPGITVSKSKSWESGNATHTQTYSLYGGVDFDFQYHAIKDDGEALTLKKTAQENKPCETALTWDFSHKGETQRAFALPIGKTNGNYLTSHTDLSLPSNNGITLELSRCYDSLNIKPTVFGYGWNLKVPYRLFIVNPQKCDSPILLLDKVISKSYKYNFIEDKKSYYLVNEEKEEGGRTSFTYNPQKFIGRNPDNTYSWMAEDGLTFNFDSKGRLISAQAKNNRKINYKYWDDRVVEISDAFGKSISLFYDPKNRVKKIIGPEQRVVSYEYDPSGDLIGVSDNEGNVVSYSYDANHRLVKAKDVKGKVVLRNSYDPLGRVVRKRQDLMADVQGNLITRTYDNNYQLIKEEDKEGNRIFYEYDKQNLVKIIISDKLGRKAIFEHDEEERIKKITNPLGHSIGFTYDASGNITSIVDANDHIQYFGYDRNGNPILIQDAMGNQWRQRFDERSRLLSITDPMGQSASLIYEDDKLISIETPEGITRCDYDDRANLLKITDANGNSTEFTYDSRNRVIQVKDALNNVTKYDYDPSGNLSSLTDAKGNIYQYTTRPSQQ